MFPARIFPYVFKNYDIGREGNVFTMLYLLYFVYYHIKPILYNDNDKDVAADLYDCKHITKFDVYMY